MLSLGSLACVAIGGAAGGLGRWGLKQWPGGHLGTWVANMLACALLGALNAATPSSSLLFLLAGTGGAGALSTWSTLAAEWGALLTGRHYRSLGAEVIASLAGGLAAAALGGWAAGALLPAL